MKQQHDWTGERIRAARKARGWTQRELAARLDIDASAVSRWERVDRRAGPDRRYRTELARILGEEVAP